MSELESSETGALTESPTLLPAHHAEPAANGTRESSTRSATEAVASEKLGTPETDGDAGAPGATPRVVELGPDGLPKKRRRRGSRGGRGRKKPGAAGGGQSSGADDESETLSGSE